MKRLLVTGVSGLLGINVAWLAAERFHVTGVMRGIHAAPPPETAAFDILLSDLTQAGEVERVMEIARPDVIIHCAALSEVDRCETQPEEAERVNTWLPGMLAQAAQQSGAKLLHISTDAVFDGEMGNYTEDDAPNPINVYARTKLDAERAVADANPNALIARVNFFGWSWQGRRSLAEFFFLNLSAGNPVKGFADIHFCPLLVNDLVEILLDMLACDLCGIYHVVSSDCQNKYEFGRMLARNFSFDENLVSPSSYTASGLKARRSPRLTLCCDKVMRALGKEMPTQAAGLQRFADLYRQGYPQNLRSLLVQPDHSHAG